MTAELPVTFSPYARRALHEAAAWWKANRTKAPHAFAEELERALSLIAAQPHVGAQAKSRRYRSLRRVYLSRIRYYLYYRIADGQSPRIEVVFIWHSSRGSRPQIREVQIIYQAA